MSALAYARSIKRGGTLLFRAIHHQIRDEWLAQRFPAKPTVVQFPVNDICNSRCVMCNIWQRKREREITPEELRRILSDSLFSEIRYVGMNGGEPTLRRDLSEIAQVLAESLPKLKGIGIITNALQPQMVIERILPLVQVAEAAGLSFDVSISLDGIGDDHDRNRGVKGNFDSAVQVIKTLRQNGIPLSISCTLTPLNCYGADDVLLWCDQNDIHQWQFRLGVEIKRIYNEGYTQRHPFTNEQRFHLIMFFDKLVNHPSVDEAHQQFYHSLSGQLAFGLPRRAGCDWRSRGVTLDTRGSISYCSVQSAILGSALERSAWLIYKKGIAQRRRILRECCDNCQHDLIGSPPPKELARHAVQLVVVPSQRQWQKLRNRLGLTADSFQALRPILPAEHDSPSQWQHVLITGWYGTETAGDKAILGELLHFLKTGAPGCRITLTTLDRKVSQQTKLELAELASVSLVDMDKSSDPALIESVDAVIIGGGPLEEIPQTEYLWRMFTEANRQRKARVMFGCGVGPLHTDRLRQMVGAICQMTTAGFLRDRESHEYAIGLGATAPLGCACDPALAYIQRWAANSLQVKQKNEPLRIVGLVRANTNEYIVDMHHADLNGFNTKTASQIAHILEPVCVTHQAKVDLLPMHALWVGGDDRIFNRQIAGFFHDQGVIRVERHYLSLEMLLQSISSADAAVAMRYHGHLFCMAVGIPFLSIDYTGDCGKVHNLTQRIGYHQWAEDWRNIDVSRATSKLQRLIEEGQHWSAYLQQQTNELVTQLYETYVQVFGGPQLQ